MLEDKVAKAKALGDRISLAIRNCDCDTKTLNALRNDAIISSISIPEISLILNTMKQVNAWEHKLRKVFPKSRSVDKKLRHPLSALESLLHDGSKLPMKARRIDEIISGIKEVKEWQARARLVLSSNASMPTLVELQLLNYQAEDIKVYVDEMIEVEQRVQNGEDWMSDFDSFKDELDQVDVEVLEHFIDRGLRLQIIMPEIELLKRHIGVRKWTVTKKQTTKTKVSLAMIQHILDQGEALIERPPEAELENLRNRIREAEDWNRRLSRCNPSLFVDCNSVDNDITYFPNYQQPLATGDEVKKISFGELNNLVNQGSRIAVRLDQLPILVKKLGIAQNWLNKANTILRNRQHNSRRQHHAANGVTSNPITTVRQLESLIAEADDLDVIVNEADHLRSFMNEINDWSKRTNLAMGDENMPGAWETSQSENETYLDGLISLSDEGKSFGLNVDVLKQLSNRIAALEWEKKSMKILDLCKHNQKLSSKKETISLDTMIEHLKASNGLVLSNSIVHELELIVSKGQTWMKRAKRLLDSKRRGMRDDEDDEEDLNCGKSSINDLARYTDLLAEAKAINIDLDGAATIENIIQSHQHWEKRVKKLFSDSSSHLGSDSGEAIEKMTLHDGTLLCRRMDRISARQLNELFNEQRDCLIESEQFKRVSSISNACSKWVERCRRAVTRRGAHELNAETLLQLIFDSINRALENSKRFDSNCHFVGPEDEEPHCLCQVTALENDSSMVCCDVCDEWFHLRCVGITKVLEKKLKHFECLFCQASHGQFDPFIHKLQDYKRYKTGRPLMSTLIDLIKQEALLEVATAEGDLLWQIIRKMEAFNDYCAHVSGKFTLIHGDLNDLMLTVAEENNLINSEKIEDKIKKEVACITDTVAAFVANERPMQNSMDDNEEESTLKEFKKDDNSLSLQSEENKDIIATLTGEQTAESSTMRKNDALIILRHLQKFALANARRCLKAALSLEVAFPTVERRLMRALFSDAWSDKMKRILNISNKNTNARTNCTSSTSSNLSKLSNDTHNDTTTANNNLEYSNVTMDYEVRAMVESAQSLHLFDNEVNDNNMSSTLSISTTSSISEPSTISISTSSADVYSYCVHSLNLNDEWLNKFREVEDDPNSFSIDAIHQLKAQLQNRLVFLLPEKQYKIDLLTEMCTEYCVCRSRYDPTRPMICCDVCDEWYHYECVGLCIPSSNDDNNSNKEEEDDEEQSYVCPRCIKDGKNDNDNKYNQSK